MQSTESRKNIAFTFRVEEPSRAEPSRAEPSRARTQHEAGSLFFLAWFYVQPRRRRQCSCETSVDTSDRDLDCTLVCFMLLESKSQAWPCHRLLVAAVMWFCDVPSGTAALSFRVFRLPLQFTFHRLLHTHLPAGTGTIG
jgi:hypothetical protein